MLLFRQDPDDVVPVDSKKRRLEENLAIRSQDADIRNGDEFLALVELILDALVPANVDVSAHQVLCRLHSGIDRSLGDNIGKSLALFVILNRHIASSGSAWVVGSVGMIYPILLIKIATENKCRYVSMQVLAPKV